MKKLLQTCAALSCAAGLLRVNGCAQERPSKTYTSEAQSSSAAADSRQETVKRDPADTVSDPVSLPDVCAVCGDEGVLECPDCEDGSVFCGSCDGDGVYVCNTCDGSGVYACAACDGMGGSTCISCQGTGIFGDEYTMFRAKCMMCNGTGYQTCAYCGGAGASVCLCSGDGVWECEECLGAGTLTCTTCSGTHRISCRACTRNNLPADNGGADIPAGGYDSPAIDYTPPVSNTQQCSECRGVGQRRCSVCNGSGCVQRLVDRPFHGGDAVGYQPTRQACSGCNGRGYVDCLRCGGDGRIY